MRLSAPTDILATVPFLIGYHPSDSIVVLGMTDHRVTFAARDDLPPPGAQPDPDQVAYLVEVLLRQGCPRLLLVGYGADERVSPIMHALMDVHSGHLAYVALRRAPAIPEPDLANLEAWADAVLAETPPEEPR